MLKQLHIKKVNIKIRNKSDFFHSRNESILSVVKTLSWTNIKLSSSLILELTTHPSLMGAVLEVGSE